MTTAVQEGTDNYPGMPRWVKVTGIVVLALVVIAIVAALALGGEHGPGRHVAP